VVLFLAQHFMGQKTWNGIVANLCFYEESLKKVFNGKKTFKTFQISKMPGSALL